MVEEKSSKRATTWFLLAAATRVFADAELISESFWPSDVTKIITCSFFSFFSTCVNCVPHNHDCHGFCFTYSCPVGILTFKGGLGLLEPRSTQLIPAIWKRGEAL